MEPKQQNSDEQKTTISRQEALRKMGKYAAATAAGTFILLSPKQAQADSLPRPGSNSTEEAESDQDRGSIWDNGDSERKSR
ncbi:MAG: hypothetical protein RIC19_09640 [Phaeodactylibacter sp.]|uniref:hypothetical protein n=1 Tax=Phaeodactylibacter sp. TaxID=1940289 RepID=UPI0032EAF8AC